MEPEEIDKLFRDKLAGRPAVPSSDAWMRLQQKMEPPKKERTMWIYYAAASVVLVLLAGVLFLQRGSDPTGPAVATAPRMAPAPAISPAAAPETDRPATIAEPEPVVAQAPVSAPGHQPAANSKQKAPAPVRQALPAERRAAKVPAATEHLAATQPAKSLATEVPAQPAPAALASAAPDLSVVEVVVKRDADPSEEAGLRENLNRKGHLLKNIYKQARNLKNGEPVELAAIGVDKNRIQEETKELKQKLSNVISL